MHVIERTLEQIRNQPVPNQHFSAEWIEILRREIDVDVGQLDFRDRHGTCMLAHPSRFGAQNSNLFGTANLDRLYTREEQAMFSGPYAIRGNPFLPFPEQDTKKLQCNNI